MPMLMHDNHLVHPPVDAHPQRRILKDDRVKLHVDLPVLQVGGALDHKVPDLCDRVVSHEPGGWGLRDGCDCASLRGYCVCCCARCGALRHDRDGDLGGGWALAAGAVLVFVRAAWTLLPAAVVAVGRGLGRAGGQHQLDCPTGGVRRGVLLILVRPLAVCSRHKGEHGVGRWVLRTAGVSR